MGQLLTDAPVTKLRIELAILQEILRLPHQLCEGSKISQQISALFSQALPKLLGQGAPPLMEDVEKCEICDETIPFENLTDAECSNGHDFSKL